MFDYFTDPNTNFWTDLLDISLRSIVSILVLFLLAKLLGNKQIKQLSFFDYVVGISIGSIAAEMATNQNIPHHFHIVAMLIYTLISMLVGLVSLKTVKGRRFIEGTPIVLVENGKILYKKLAQAQMTVNSLLAECRFAGYFNIADVDTAVLETSGEVSILPKPSAKPVTVGDMNLETTPQKPCANVIIDGVIMPHNLFAVHKTQQWLTQKLKEKNVDVKNVLLATLDSQGKLELYDKRVKPKRYDMFD